MISVRALDIFGQEISIGDICLVPEYNNQLNCIQFGFIKILSNVKYVSGNLCTVDSLIRVYDFVSQTYKFREYSNFGYECTIISDEPLIKIHDVMKINNPLFAMNNDYLLSILGAEYEKR